MFTSHSFFWLLVVYTARAAPQQTNPSDCKIVQSGNLSPNGVSGNFGLFNDVLAFDPTNLATGFDVSLEVCSSGATVQGATDAGSLIAPTGTCLAVQNATATQGPTVIAVDCATADVRSDMTWAMQEGFLFWAGSTSTCASGLYGYKAVGSSGAPDAVQKAPIGLGCSTDSGVFGFSVLI